MVRKRCGTGPIAVGRQFAQCRGSRGTELDVRSLRGYGGSQERCCAPTGRCDRRSACRVSCRGRDRVHKDSWRLNGRITASTTKSKGYLLPKPSSTVLRWSCSHEDVDLGPICGMRLSEESLSDALGCEGGNKNTSLPLSTRNREYSTTYLYLLVLTCTTCTTCSTTDRQKLLNKRPSGTAWCMVLSRTARLWR